MLNYAHQLIKIRLAFHTPYLWNEASDPQFNFYSFLKQVNHYLSAEEVLKQIYRVENFRANVRKRPAWIGWSSLSNASTLVIQRISTRRELGSRDIASKAGTPSCNCANFYNPLKEENEF